jgi:hypothetical protein
MSDIVLLNKHQKKALVIELYKQAKTRRQIAEAVHMSFKDTAGILTNIQAKLSKLTNQRNRISHSQLMDPSYRVRFFCVLAFQSHS